MTSFQQFIAAFLLFVFTGLVSAPAMAGVASCALEDEAKETCCCSSAEEPADENVAASDCQCPACACTVEQQQTPSPWMPIATSGDLVEVSGLPGHSLPGVLALHIASEPYASGSPRGPPAKSSAPLYLLYDSFLI